MKRSTIRFLALFLAVMAGSAFAQSKILNVKGLAQTQDQWCWAASSESMLYNWGIEIDQCEIVNKVRVLNPQTFGSSNCCPAGASRACNKPNNIHTSRGNIMDGMREAGNIQTQSLRSSITQAQFKAQIDANQPFIVAWMWNQGGGHAVVGYGYNGDQVYIMDPWQYRAAKIMTYSQSLNAQGQGRWAETMTTTAPPALSSQIQVSSSSVSVSSQVLSSQIQVSSSTVSEDGCSAEPCKAGTFYTQGAVCSYDGHEWEAKWWVNTLPPGEYWEDLGACEGTSSDGETLSSSSSDEEGDVNDGDEDATIVTRPETLPTGWNLLRADRNGCDLALPSGQMVQLQVVSVTGRLLRDQSVEGVGGVAHYGWSHPLPVGVHYIVATSAGHRALLGTVRVDH